MNYAKITRPITENLSLKIISLIFAFMLWLYVTAQQVETQMVKAPLGVRNVPENLAIVSELPQYVEVSIKGSRSELLKLRFFNKLKAVVDCSDAKAGRLNIPLSPAILTLPNKVDIRNVTIESPRMLSIEFENVITKSVPVKIAFKGKIPDDVIIGKPVIVPDKVKLTGPSSRVNAINLVNTEEIEIRGKKKKFSQEVMVHVPEKGVVVQPDRILVEMDISKKVVRTLANLPPTLLQDDESAEVEYSPKTVSLIIEGPEDVIRNIAKDDVSIIINIASRKPGEYKIRPQVIVPQGIDKYWLDTDEFDIKILKKTGSDEKK
ncbi:MAG: hypothetical protein B6D63_00045 [Candidatus Latescibacteria bacterium 4484_7]|nr:MAG: hypothetical protein B6D63_00045 [Candidatus Latescibacteria bacterium 4484_7]